MFWNRWIELNKQIIFIIVYSEIQININEIVKRFKKYSAQQ